MTPPPKHPHAPDPADADLQWAPYVPCTRCEGRLFAERSRKRKLGPVCWHKEREARMRDPRQLSMPWGEEARA